MQEHSDNNHPVSNLLIKWKLHFIIVTIMSVVTAMILNGWVIRPKYSSFAIVYPSDIVSFGSESPSQQMLQVFESADVKNTVIRKMNLAGHYEIDSSLKSGIEKLTHVYESNVCIIPTSLGSVKIEVEDTDPHVACAMVNAIIHAFNMKEQTLHKNKTTEQVAVIKSELLDQKTTGRFAK